MKGARAPRLAFLLRGAADLGLRCPPLQEADAAMSAAMTRPCVSATSSSRAYPPSCSATTLPPLRPVACGVWKAGCEETLRLQAGGTARATGSIDSGWILSQAAHM